MLYTGESFTDLIVFQNIPYATVQNILERCPIRTLEPGEILLKPQNPNYSFFQVLEGELTVHLKDLSTPSIATMVKGSCIGELSIIDEKNASAYVLSQTKSRLLVIDKQSLQKILSASNEFVFNLLRIFSHRMRFNTEALVESQFVRTVPDIIYRLDKEGKFIFLNESIEKLGYQVKDLLGKHFEVLISNEDIDKVSYHNMLQQIRTTGKAPDSPPKLFDERRSEGRKTLGLELRLKLNNKTVSVPGRSDVVPDDQIVAEVNCTGLKRSFNDGKIADSYLGTIGIIRDITERQMFQNQVAEQKARIEAIFETMADAIVVVNANGILESVNHAATKIFGYQESEMLGKNVAMLIPSPNCEQHDSYLAHFFATGESKYIGMRQETIAKRKNGHEFEIDLAITEVRLHNRRIFTAVIRDITQRKEAERIIHYQANHDALTDLPNRSMFMKILEREIKSAENNKLRIALMFIDLDRFKWINDNLGHAAGDQLLQMSAKRLTRCLKSGDSVARLGGDEFTAILVNIENMEQVVHVAHRILEQLNQAFNLSEQEVFISGSLGIALYPEDANNREDLLKLADEAMYRSKNAGRNAFHFYSGPSHIRPKKY
ncbi:MAG: diguanylate cyclase [Magnetococcus sp. DMHC-6]